MPRPKSDFDLETHKVRLVKGDFAAMGDLYPQRGATVAIRELVHAHVQRVRASLEPVDISINETDLQEILPHD